MPLLKIRSQNFSNSAKSRSSNEPAELTSQDRQRDSSLYRHWFLRRLVHLFRDSEGGRIASSLPAIIVASNHPNPEQRRLHPPSRFRRAVVRSRASEHQLPH